MNKCRGLNAKPNRSRCSWKLTHISYSTGRHLFRAGVNYRLNPEADLEGANVSVGKFSLFGMTSSRAEYCRGVVRTVSARLLMPLPYFTSGCTTSEVTFRTNGHLLRT